MRFTRLIPALAVAMLGVACAQDAPTAPEAPQFSEHAGAPLAFPFENVPFAGVNPVSREWVPYGTPVVGHAEMNLRYYAGGDEPQVLQPGTRYEAQIQFEPLEVRIPEGHRLSLWIFQYHFEDRQDVTTKAPVTVFLGDGAKLRLPTLDLDPRTVFPVPGAHFLNNSYVPEMYVQYPPLSTGSGAPVAAPQADTRAASAKQECLVCL